MKNIPQFVLLKTQTKAQIFSVATLLKKLRIKKTTAHLSETSLTFSRLPEYIRAIGATPKMDDYERRKLGIFNLLNFFQLLTGLIVPLLVIGAEKNLSSLSLLQSLLPCFVSLSVLTLNYYKKHDSALIFYFILYPVVTSIIYLGGMNLGIELFFILYGILSVFFIQQLGQMLFTMALSMISYFVLSVLWKNYYYDLEKANTAFFMLNQLLAVVFIFYGLYLIKTENGDYQLRILSKSRMLHKKNLEINKQKKEIESKARLLEKQAAELAESNSIKNKLFSVIAHDLRTPMYALRNLFQNISSRNLSRAEMNELIPEVVKDLSFTTDLIENLLYWAKNQMQGHSVKQQLLDVSKLTSEVVNISRLQLKTKDIQLENKLPSSLQISADRDMVHVVLRNLVSNAIKFTPNKGRITIGAKEMEGFVEIYIRDTGVGISSDGLQKIRQNIFFSTKGTINETGTGLGLMLCREFIIKNGGHIFIESEQGQGTTISFTLPRGDQLLKAV